MRLAMGTWAAVLLTISSRSIATAQRSASEYLSWGDDALRSENIPLAIRRYREGISSLPAPRASDLPVLLSLYTNMGTAQSMAESTAESMRSYELALDALSKWPEAPAADERIGAQAAFYLGMGYHDLGEAGLAEEYYKRSVELDPNHWSSLANLASLHLDVSSNALASIQAYHSSIQILTSPSPTDPPVDVPSTLSDLHYRLGMALAQTTGRCTLGPASAPCERLATRAFSQSVEHDPENQEAKHMLAALTADGSLERASDEYVRDLFEKYAASFEESLEELGYDGFARLRRGLDGVFKGETPVFSLVLDLGCGTGLAGQQFRNVSSTLVGIDLSPAILAEADKKDLYDRTIVGDALKILRDFPQTPDLLVAADSLIYFGDLEPLFGAFARLEEGGYAAFTLENVPDEQSLHEAKPDWRWQLTASGRFAHRKSYVEGLAAKHGFLVELYTSMDGFRLEKGVPVRGHLFVLRKRSSSKEEL